MNGVPTDELPTDEQGKPFIPGYSLHEAVEMLQVGGKEARRAGEEGDRAWRGERGGGGRGSVIVKRVWVTGNAVVEMGWFVGVGAAVAVVVMEVRRRRRVAYGQHYAEV